MLSVISAFCQGTLMSCSFKNYTFIFLKCLEPLHLVCFELHGRFATEHGDEYLYFAAIFVDFTYFAFEILERTVDNDDRVTLTEIDGVADGLAGGALQDFFDFFAAERHCLIRSTNKASHLRRVAHDAPCLIGRDHLHEHVALEKFFLYLGLAAVLDANLFLGRYDDIEDSVLHAKGLDALLQIARDRIFVARVCVDRVPCSLACVCLSGHKISCWLLVIWLLANALLRDWDFDSGENTVRGRCRFGCAR